MKWIFLFPVVSLALPLAPNPQLTPGAWNNPPTPLFTLCHPGYAERARRVSEAMKLKVFKLYGIKPSGGYEVDHLVPLELDGSNAIENLWPESYTTKPLNAHSKDKLENFLHKQVCNDKMLLLDVQKMIAKDWIGAYKRFFGGRNG
jgi:hypothetical protein